MSKENIKKQLGREKDFELIDTHRPIPRSEGGRYVDGNVELAEPIDHMKTHGIYREREESMNRLKSLYDGYKQIQKLRMKVNNQILAMKRGVDQLDEITVAFIEGVLGEINDKEKAQSKLIASWVKENREIPIVKAMESVKGVGPVTIAACLAYLDPHKAKHVSSFWSYAGYRCADHERFDKLPEPVPVTDRNTGEVILNNNGKPKMRHHNPGNQTLRCQLYVTAGVFVKQGGPYREIYDRRKLKTSQSVKITKSRITGKSGVTEVAWKDAPAGHRHGDALRVMMKSFLADLWFVWRTLEGLPTDDLYVKEHLGHQSAVIEPEKRGWAF